MKMRAEDKTKWLEALRSGEYKQCASTLHDGVGYCCLGVLEKVLSGDVERSPSGNPIGVPSKEWLDDHKIEVETRAINTYSSASTRKDYYADTATSKNYYNVDSQGVFSTLMCLNDETIVEVDDDGVEHETFDHTHTFKDIANYIEKNVETY